MRRGDQLGLQISKIEELLQLRNTERTNGCLGRLLPVPAPIQVRDDLREHGPEQAPAVLVPVIGRIAGELEEQLHIALISANGLMR